MKGSFRKMMMKKKINVESLIIILSLFFIAIIIPIYYYYYYPHNNDNNTYSSKLAAAAAAYNSLNIQTITNNNYIPIPTPALAPDPAINIIINKSSELLYSKAKEYQEEEEEEPATAAAAAAAISNNNCDLSVGEWVSNPEAPYYTNTTCSHMQEHQNCMKYGRPDTDFLKWRWKPQGQGCDLPIFDPLQFLEMMRGKKMAFVGDSVARNHMQSLICLLSKVEEAVDVSTTSWSQFKRYDFTKHNFSLAMFWSPYLVRTRQDTTQNNADNNPYDLFLDEADPKWTQEIHHFNYIIISAGHWFARPTIFYIQNQIAGCLYCPPQSNITQLTSNFSYRHAFRTAFRAIAQQTNFSGITILRSFVPSHFENGSWNEGGHCVRQRPYSKRAEESELKGYVMELYEIQLEELKIAQQQEQEQEQEQVQVGEQGRGLKFRMIDVTRAMLMRPDGHPSKYWRWSAPADHVSLINDCVHWCLPGPVDSWNDFLIQLLRTEEQQINTTTAT